MFEWNSLNPWGAGFEPVAAMFALSVVLAPFALVGGWIHRKWRQGHPRPEPTTMREAAEIARKRGLL